MTALSITRTDLTVGQPRTAAARHPDPRVVRRILAIAMVLDGHSRRAAAEAQAMDRQTLRDWIIRFNEHGIDGLADRPRPSRPPRLDPEQRAEAGTWVDPGPDPATDGMVRWHRRDPRERILRRFGVRMHERTVGKLLRRPDFRRMSVRPQHPGSDEAAQEAYKKTSPRGSATPSRQGASRTGRSRSGSRTRPGSAGRGR